MPDNDTWPPKPALPDPLTEYDDVIAAKLAALSETGPNKIHLVKALRDEEGIDLSQAYAAVNSYCDRHGALAQTRASRIRAWLGCLPRGFFLCTIGYAVYWMGWLDEIASLPHNRAAFHVLVLNKKALIISLVAFVFPFVILGAVLIRLRTRRRK